MKTAISRWKTHLLDGAKIWTSQDEKDALSIISLIDKVGEWRLRARTDLELDTKGGILCKNLAKEIRDFGEDK